MQKNKKFKKMGDHMINILVVEDDTMINQVICEFLKENNYNVESVFDGEEALNKFSEKEFDLVILDVMIPKIDGITVLKSIRETSDVPVMMVTAVDDEITQLVSFNHLISDYVVKPFSPVILIKRIENILRTIETSDILKIADIEINLENGYVSRNGEEVNLTKKEYEILVFLIKRRGKVVSREYIMSSIWGYTEFCSRVLDNHMKNLRKKLPSLPLRTIIGRGYQLGGN